MRNGGKGASGNFSAVLESGGKEMKMSLHLWEGMLYMY